MELEGCQVIYFCSMVENLKIEELARPFIERDLSAGRSLTQISRKYDIGRTVVYRIRNEFGFEKNKKAHPVFG